MIVADTHVVVWLSEDPGLLSRAAQDALLHERLSGTLVVADITLREIAVQAGRGRIALPISVAEYLARVESLFRIVPVSGAIAERSTSFSLKYPRDPADRLIGATALVHGARLVTADAAIRASGEVECIW